MRSSRRNLSGHYTLWEPDERASVEKENPSVEGLWIYDEERDKTACGVYFGNFGSTVDANCDNPVFHSAQGFQVGVEASAGSVTLSDDCGGSIELDEDMSNQYSTYFQWTVPSTVTRCRHTATTVHQGLEGELSVIKAPRAALERSHIERASRIAQALNGSP